MKTWPKRTLIAVGCVGAAPVMAGAGLFVVGAPPAPTIADVAYGTGDAQRFDVWKPAGPGPMPVVLAVHGGAFKFGDKRSHDGLKGEIAILLAHGIAVASKNYR